MNNEIFKTYNDLCYRQDLNSPHLFFYSILFIWFFQITFFIPSFGFNFLYPTDSIIYYSPHTHCRNINQKNQKLKKVKQNYLPNTHAEEWPLKPL